jgi:hypothetical protein
MQYLLMESIHRDDIIAIFIICLGISAISAVMSWRGWGIDIHKHLEEAGVAYDELHPEERAEQERREQAGPVGPTH